MDATWYATQAQPLQSLGQSVVPLTFAVAVEVMVIQTVLDKTAFAGPRDMFRQPWYWTPMERWQTCNCAIFTPQTAKCT